MPDMKTEVTVVAHIRAKPNSVGLVRQELKKLVPITRDEAGCLRYDLHEDNASPAHFIFIENWASRELWQAHLDAPHIAAFNAATDGAIEAVELHELAQIS